MRETPEAAKAFEQYYDLGDDRSLEALAKQMHQDLLAGQQGYQSHTKSIPTTATILTRLKKWSSSHQWQSRIIERDREEARKERKKKQKELDRMNEEHALMGRTQALRMVKHIQDLIEAKSFGSQASVQLFKYATDLERIARGASTEQIALTDKDGGPVIHSETADLTDEELQLVIEAAAALKQRREQ